MENSISTTYNPRHNSEGTILQQDNPRHAGEGTILQWAKGQSYNGRKDNPIIPLPYEYELMNNSLNNLLLSSSSNGFKKDNSSKAEKNSQNQKPMIDDDNKNKISKTQKTSVSKKNIDLNEYLIEIHENLFAKNPSRKEVNFIKK